MNSHFKRVLSVNVFFISFVFFLKPSAIGKGINITITPIDIIIIYSYDSLFSLPAQCPSLR